MNQHVKTDLAAEPQALAEPTIASPETKRLSRTPFLIVALLALGAIGWGVHVHAARDALAAQTQDETARFEPTLHVVEVMKTPGVIDLDLPGTTVAFEQARIFARATGYLAERRVDIGSRVHAGDLLARIAAPDLDQQLGQAVATLDQRKAALQQAQASVAQARSNKDLANVTDARISKLAREGWATLQNADQTRLGLSAQDAAVASAQADVAVATANVEAQAATVRQLRELTGFETVTAPFDGVVTQRNVDTGDLISGTALGGTALFVLERDDVLRVHVDVPQSASVGLRDGLVARVALPERPGDVFEGKVARNAGSINVTSRTLSAEVDVANPAGLLHPGLYVRVALAIPQASPSVSVPAGAILFNGQGLRVATVDVDGKVAMRDVTIYRDFGTSVELRSGLDGGEQVAVSPPADLRDGQSVHVAPVAGMANKASGGPAPSSGKS